MRVWPVVQVGVEQGWQPWVDWLEYVLNGQEEHGAAPCSDVRPAGHWIVVGEIVMYWVW